MGNCLVTKLKGIVQNDNLIGLGEVPFNVVSSGVCVVGVRVNNGESVTLKTKGTTFTDGTTSKTLYESGDVYLNGADNAKLILNNKYNLVALNMNGYLAGKLDDLEYSASLSNIFKGRFTGNFDVLKRLMSEGSLTSINILGDAGLIGDISNIGPYVTAVNTFILEMTGISGDITGILRNLVSLTNNLVSIVSVNENKIYGDISYVDHNNVKALFTNAVLHWSSERSSSFEIIAVSGGCDFGSDLDAMLINQANCITGSMISNPDTRYSTIDVLGSKTSASDAAVATLKNKGYTVIVNGVTL